MLKDAERCYKKIRLARTSLIVFTSRRPLNTIFPVPVEKRSMRLYSQNEFRDEEKAPVALFPESELMRATKCVPILLFSTGGNVSSYYLDLLH